MNDISWSKNQINIKNRAFLNRKSSIFYFIFMDFNVISNNSNKILTDW